MDYIVSGRQSPLLKIPSRGARPQANVAIESHIMEVSVWFYRRSSRINGRIILEVNDELSFQIRQAARARERPVEAYTVELLKRGLQQDALRAQVQAILKNLTPREQEVARLTARGYTNPKIAKTLVISPETVKTHVRHVLDKLGLRSKADLRLLLNLRVRWWEEIPSERASSDVIP